jgi:hypothetical protein
MPDAVGTTVWVATLPVDCCAGIELVGGSAARTPLCQFPFFNFTFLIHPSAH